MASAAKATAKPAAKAPRRATLTETDNARLHLETGCSLSTIRAWAAGAKVRPSTSKALERACQKFAIQVLS